MKTRPAILVAAAAALFVLLAIASTWPLATNPGHLSLAGEFNNDFHFNTFVVLWGAHAITTDPLSLHHTNMFWPERYTFAYSDISLSHSLLVLPILWVSYNPTLAINGLILASIVIGGVGGFVLGRHLTGSNLAGIAGGLVYVFNPAHFARHLQIQYFGDHWAPWLVLTLVLWLERRSLRWALAAAAMFILHALTGSHAAVFAAVITAVVVSVYAVRTGAWRRPWLWRGTAVFTLVVAAVLGPIFYPYLLVQDGLAAERGDNPAALLNGSAHARDLLSGGSRLYSAIEERWGWPSDVVPGRLGAHLFPGLVALMLAAAALLARRRDPRGAARPGDPITWVVLFALCLLLALGPAWKLYDILSLVPGIRLIRVPSRFLLPGLLALAMLAAYGAAALSERLSRRSLVAVMSIAASVFAIEASFAPLSTAVVSGGPDPVNAWLARQPGDFAVLEVPVRVDNLTAHSRQLRQSVFHFKKLLVGYSGWRSEAVRERLERLDRTIPSAAALAELDQLGVRYLIAVENRLPADFPERLRASGRLTVVENLDTISIWQLHAEEPSDPRSRP